MNQSTTLLPLKSRSTGRLMFRVRHATYDDTALKIRRHTDKKKRSASVDILMKHVKTCNGRLASYSYGAITEKLRKNIPTMVLTIITGVMSDKRRMMVYNLQMNRC